MVDSLKSVISNPKAIIMSGAATVALASISIIYPLALLITAVLIVFYLILRDYRAGVLLLVIFSFTNIAAQEYIESYHVMMLTTVITLCSLVLASLRGTVTFRSCKELDFLLISFGIWAFFSGVYADEHLLWATYIYWMIRAYFIFYLVYNSFSKLEDIVFIFKVIALSLFLSTLLSFIMNFGLSFTSLQNLISIFLSRFRGTIFDPNYFSMTVAATLPIIIVLTIREKRIFFKLCWIFAALFLMFSIVISQSRTGLASVAFVFLYALLYLVRRKRKESIVFIVAIVIVLFLIPSVFWHRLSILWQSMITGTRGDFSMIHRTLLLKSAFNIFAQNPVFGVGLGNFEAIAGRYINYPMICHNTYLEIASNLGLIGFIPFALILYKGFTILRTALNTSMTSELAWALRASLLGSFIAMFFLSVPFKLDLWVLLALAATTARLVQDNTSLITLTARGASKQKAMSNPSR